MRRRTSRPRPPRSATPSSLPAKSTHSTVPKGLRPVLPTPRGAARTSTVAPTSARRRHVARIVDEDESSLLDLIDNLLAKGVMLNADLILALANVDLVYVRLSALLCAADRVLPRPPVSPKRRSGGGPVSSKPQSGEGG